MLSDVWRGIISIGGFLLTFAGLLYTARQVWLAKDAAEAAKHAANQMLDESRKSFRRYAASNAHRFVNEAKVFIESAEWGFAAMRLSDLADQLGQLGALSLSAGQSAADARKWSGTCGRLASGQLSRFPALRWIDFCVGLQSVLDSLHSPFAAGEDSE